MFGKKLIVVAAAVALAMGHVAAVDQATHVKVAVASYKTQHHTIALYKQADANATTVPTPAPATEDAEDDEGSDSDSAEEEEKEEAEEEDGEEADGSEDDGSEEDGSADDEGTDGTADVEIDIVLEGNSTSTTSDETEEEVSLCIPGWTEVSVEGVDDIFCAKGQICVADIKDGSCPSPQHGLPLGAYCDVVKTGVYGCKPVTEDMLKEEDSPYKPVCVGKDESPMSVEGVEGVFCVTGQACVADIKDGACPEAQEGLEYGAYCGTVKTGVYGCKPKTKEMYDNEQVPDEEDGSDDSEEEEATTTAPTAAPTVAPATTPAPAPVCSGPGQSPMSVEGVEGVFCVSGQACVADIDGACPGKQEGLPFGAYCGTVASGVKGCKPNTSKHQMKKHAKAAKANVCSGPGQSPMSVEGVEGVFCVTGQACVANIQNGACPDQQAGLPWGAYCDKVKTGVYGCKPQTEEMWKAKHQQSGSNGLCTGPGQSPMSVEGVEGVFCVTGQACVANIDGACPGKQTGLPFGSYCGTVKTGVKGCKPNTSKHQMKKHAKAAKANVCSGPGQSPMSVEGVPGVFCVTGQACVANINGACPGKQPGLPFGSYCGYVKTGVKGCKPNYGKHTKGHKIKVTKVSAKKIHHKKH